MGAARTIRRARWAALAVVAAALTGCASLGGGDEVVPGSGPETGGDDGGAPADLLVQVGYQGGFVPVGWDFSSVPRLTVYTDGLAVVHGPTTLEFPGRMLPNLLTHRLPQESVEALLAAAEDAGLVGEAPDYGVPPVTDVGDTVVTLVVDGITTVHRAYALEIDLDLPDDGGQGGLTEAQVEARDTLEAFIATVEAEVEAAPEEGPYEPTGYAVMARPVEGEPGGDLAPATFEWPLAVDLAQAECVVVDGDDGRVLGALLTDARNGDRFTQDGVAYDVWARVLLPGEVGCGGGTA